MTGRILVVAPSWVGDLVIAQPMIGALAADGSRVDLLAVPWVAPLARRLPGVAQVIGAPFAHGELALGRRRALARELATMGYTQAVVLPNSAKSALVPWLARIPRRTGFRGEMRWLLLNDIRPLDKAALPRLVDRFMVLAGGAPATEPRIPVLPEQRAELLRRLGLGGTRRVACLCPGAEYGPAKRWPARHFAALADALSERDFDIWLLGSAKDGTAAAEIAALARHPVRNLAGSTSLDEAADLLGGATVAVTNDSGLMHVAAAVGVPVLALFGSSSPAYTPPLSARARIVRQDLPCSPCFQRECPLGHFRCLDSLEPSRVLSEMRLLGVAQA